MGEEATKSEGEDDGGKFNREDEARIIAHRKKQRFQVRDTEQGRDETHAAIKRYYCENDQITYANVSSRMSLQVGREVTSDTEAIRVGRNRGKGEQKSKTQIEKGVSGCNHRGADNRWSNFPTQPPLRDRNDGLPGGLDRITVSKLRNESIKAAGNAVVPQVVYEIFKAIQKYEDNERL